MKRHAEFDPLSARLGGREIRQGRLQQERTQHIMVQPVISETNEFRPRTIPQVGGT
ncbi:hypothetical protein [Microvirga vignae]|uniref:hypothetical protein n=1 Tax=Microvirga vignae TaxID=1225564 RepID=UPI001364D15A|nr:hypothetical protein [Microvirga vignae]